MRVVLTGGGTGGHIYPAIAIADKIKEKDPNAEILYIGKVNGLETEIVPKAGYKIKTVVSKGIDRKNILKVIDTGLTTLKGTRQALRIIKDFKPDVAIGTGGFVCVPVMLAASRYGARCYLHEQNAYPGVANRMLEKRVNKIFLGFKEASEFFKEKDKHVYVGNPVRKAFYDANQGEARKHLGFNKDDFVVFAFGGSQGAAPLNKVSIDIVKAVNGQPDIKFIFGTGKKHYDEILKTLENEGVEIDSNIIIKDYIDNMPDYIAASDLIISRSGALSVAETCVCGKASIMIPLPYATGNHQFFNAKTVADKGGAILIEEKDLNSEDVIRHIMNLRNNQDILETMSTASFNCRPIDTCDLIFAEIKNDGNL